MADTDCPWDSSEEGIRPSGGAIPPVPQDLGISWQLGSSRQRQIERHVTWKQPRKHTVIDLRFSVMFVQHVDQNGAILGDFLYGDIPGG